MFSRNICALRGLADARTMHFDAKWDCSIADAAESHSRTDAKNEMKAKSSLFVGSNRCVSDSDGPQRLFELLLIDLQQYLTLPLCPHSLVFFLRGLKNVARDWKISRKREAGDNKISDQSSVPFVTTLTLNCPLIRILVEVFSWYIARFINVYFPLDSLRRSTNILFFCFYFYQPDRVR